MLPRSIQGTSVGLESSRLAAHLQWLDRPTLRVTLEFVRGRGSRVRGAVLDSLLRVARHSTPQALEERGHQVTRRFTLSPQIHDAARRACTLSRSGFTGLTIPNGSAAARTLRQAPPGPRLQRLTPLVPGSAS